MLGALLAGADVAAEAGGLPLVGLTARVAPLEVAALLAEDHGLARRADELSAPILLIRREANSVALDDLGAERLVAHSAVFGDLIGRHDLAERRAAAAILLNHGGDLRLRVLRKRAALRVLLL